MRYKFTEKRLKVMQAYFDIYGRYLKCASNDKEITETKLSHLEFWVQKCTDFIDQYQITKEELVQYNLIYRVSID